MTNDERDDANDSQALITKHRALVARISYLSQNGPDLKFTAMQVCCAMANPSASDLKPAQEGLDANRVPVPLAAWW